MNKSKTLTLLLIGIISMTGCSSAKADSSSDDNLIKEVTVSKGSIREEISLSGSVVASKITSVTSSEKSTISEIYVDPNEEVSEGEDIILLESGNVIEAPFDGKIGTISVSVGDSIDSSTTVFNIIDNSSFIIETSVDETEVTKLSKDQNVEVTVSAINKEFEGVVTSIDGQATTNGNSATFGVVITLNGEFDNLYSGMSAEMNIIIKESNDVLVVPVQAIKNQKGKYVVSVKDGDTTKSAEVKIGAQDSSFVEIKSGLDEGDIIIYEQTSRSSQNKEQRSSGGQMPNAAERPNIQNGNSKNGNNEKPNMPSGSKQN